MKTDWMLVYLEAMERDDTRDFCPGMPFLPRDARLSAPVAHTDTRFAFTPPTSLAAWNKRRAELRLRAHSFLLTVVDERIRA